MKVTKVTRVGVTKLIEVTRGIKAFFIIVPTVDRVVELAGYRIE
jgi:hypothetical protein